jgi:hypothetical protein
MHGVVNFSGWWLVQRLSGFQGKWAIFGAVVGFTVVVHVVPGFHSVFASTPTVAMIWSSTPLAIWGGGGMYDRGSLGFFLAEMV